MAPEDRPSGHQSTDAVNGNETETGSAVSEVGVWVLLSTLLLGLALTSVYLSMNRVEYEFLRGWLPTFGYREFALVTATAAGLSVIQAYRFNMAER